MDHLEVVNQKLGGGELPLPPCEILPRLRPGHVIWRKMVRLPATVVTVIGIGYRWVAQVFIEI